jgi:hypothetical protein
VVDDSLTVAEWVFGIAGVSDHARAGNRIGRKPCSHAQTPHGDGVCGTSNMCGLKAHTGFELDAL